MEINSNIGIGSVIDAISSAEKPKETAGGEDFANILGEALQSASETEKESDQGTADLLSGEDVTIHETMAQAEKAELALELALQVRNKVVDAYKEIMQMQL